MLFFFHNCNIQCNIFKKVPLKDRVTEKRREQRNKKRNKDLLSASVQSEVAAAAQPGTNHSQDGFIAYFEFSLFVSTQTNLPSKGRLYQYPLKLFFKMLVLQAWL